METSVPEGDETGIVTSVPEEDTAPAVPVVGHSDAPSDVKLTASKFQSHDNNNDLNTMPISSSDEGVGASQDDTQPATHHTVTQQVAQLVILSNLFSFGLLQTHVNMVNVAMHSSQCCH